MRTTAIRVNFGAIKGSFPERRRFRSNAHVNQIAVGIDKPQAIGRMAPPGN
jgi:hypothetical protein